MSGCSFALEGLLDVAYSRMASTELRWHGEPAFLPLSYDLLIIGVLRIVLRALMPELHRLEDEQIRIR
jgi:hypothetical protein